VREEFRRAVHTQGLKRLSRFESTKNPELRFHALLTKEEPELELALV
jgi:hypothetical protein